MPYFLEMADPTAVELMRAIKKDFDPLGILGPDRVLGVGETGTGATS
jgi:FAD/FMN-containing dehydrogenase